MAIFKIKRFNPEKQPDPYFEEFEMDVSDGITVLDCLNEIKWTQDGSLTFRMSCRSAICGSCAVRVNGRALLACQRHASDLLRDNMVVIEPLGNMKVIKDLVTDFKQFWEKVEKVKPYLQPDKHEEPKERLQSPEQFKLIDDAGTCIMCGACYSDCNTLEVDDNFLGPAALAKAQRFVSDSRDTKTLERVKALSEPGGIWDCTHCGECVERCPKPAEPFYRIKEIMTVALKEGVHNNNGARHALSFTKSVTHSGRLNENQIPVESMGYFNIKGLLSLIPIGLRRLMKRKIPPIIHKAVDDVEDVKRIAREFGE